MAQPTETFDFKSAIANAIAVFEGAADKKDATAIATLYTEDAKLLPPGSPMIQGRQNIQQFWKSFFDAGASDGRLTTVEVNSTGDVAYEVGAFEANMPGAGRSHGKYVVIWKRQPDGTIRMAVDIFNINT
jgi:uncharacterized protein (TIGR02246 family)